MTHPVSGIFALIMAFGLITTSVSQQAQPDSSSDPLVKAQLLSEEEADALIEDIKRNAAEAEVQLGKLSRSDRIDIGVVVERNEFDPQRILDWLATETIWTPYRGLLRGSHGVLMDRRGNSLDRSLLLSELLETAGFDTRLAKATLQVDELDSIRSKPAPSPSVPDDGVARVLEGQALAGSQIRQQAMEIASTLSRKLDGRFEETETQRSVENEHDYWWVQTRIDSGWVDFDPQRRGEGALKIEPEQILAADELPAELRHRLEIRLVIESLSKGKLVETVSLSGEVKADNLRTGQFLEIGFLPYSAAWDDNDESDGPMSETEIATTAEVWLPVLKSNEKTEYGEWFSKEGQVVDSPFSYVGKKKVSAAATALEALGANNDAAEEPEQKLSAVWLEYAVYRPGMEPEITRREVIDLLGPNRRPDPPAKFDIDANAELQRGLALQMRTNVLPLNSTPALEAVQRSVLEFWVRNRNPFIAMVYQAAGRVDERIEPALEQLHHQPVDLVAIASIRHQISPYSEHIYLDRINVLSNHFFPGINQEGISENFGIDIVANHIGVLPGGNAEPASVRIAQGVIDTFAETVVLESGTAFNTFQLSLDQAAGLDKWISVFQPTDVNASADLPADSLGRIRQSLTEGAMAIVLPQPVEFSGEPFASWWQVDKATGTTIGRGFRGWGTQLTEKTVKNIIVNGAVRKAAKKQGAALGCKMAIVATTVAERVVVAELHAQGVAKLPVRRFQRACYILK